jgi:hypothetical protein
MFGHHRCCCGTGSCDRAHVGYAADLVWPDHPLGSGFATWYNQCGFAGSVNYGFNPDYPINYGSGRFYVGVRPRSGTSTLPDQQWGLAIDDPLLGTYLTAWGPCARTPYQVQSFALRPDLPTLSVPGLVQFYMDMRAYHGLHHDGWRMTAVAGVQHDVYLNVGEVTSPPPANPPAYAYHYTPFNSFSMAFQSDILPDDQLPDTVTMTAIGGQGVYASAIAPFGALTLTRLPQVLIDPPSTITIEVRTYEMTYVEVPDPYGGTWPVEAGFDLARHETVTLFRVCPNYRQISVGGYRAGWTEYHQVSGPGYSELSAWRSIDGRVVGVDFDSSRRVYSSQTRYVEVSVIG